MKCEINIVYNLYWNTTNFSRLYLIDVEKGAIVSVKFAWKKNMCRQP